jgi:hypothetical protein
MIFLIRVFIIFIFFSFDACAGVFSIVPYDNNPDKFCREGMPSHGWKPVDYRTGTWRPTGKRKHVNPMWIPTYQTICPSGAMKDFTGEGSADNGVPPESSTSSAPRRAAPTDPAAVP